MIVNTTSLDDDLGCVGDGSVPEDEFSRVMTTFNERKANWDDQVNGGPKMDCSPSFCLK